MNEDFNKMVEQFMLFDKKTLAELLALKELAERIDVPVVPSYPQYPTPPTSPYPYPYPWWPGIGDYPWWPQVWYTTTSNGKEYENWDQRKNVNDFCAGNAQNKCDCRHDVVQDTRTQCDYSDRINNFN
jgi:hypothetical protein